MATRGGTITTSFFSTRLTGSQPRRANGWWFLRLARGRTTWSIDGRGISLREGDIAWVRPGQVFGGFESTESAAIEVERIELDPGEGGHPNAEGALRRCLGGDVSGERLLEDRLGQADPAILRGDQECGRLFAALARSPEPKSELARLHLRAGVSRLLTGICLRLEEEPITGSARSPSESAVATVLRELEQHCDEEWTLETLAAAAGLKRSRFGALCRRLTGESPGTYLNRLRIRRGRRLLRETDRTVTDIAFDCGFSSSQYFAKIFRRFQGHEPTHYRKVAREGRAREGLHYLKGERGHNLALADRDVGAGDFVVEAEIALDRLGDTAASLEFGADRFGFDGHEGRFFLEGETFGDARFFQRSAEVIREGDPFSFVLRREGPRLALSIDGRRIFSLEDEPDRAVGRVGLRPLRNGIRVLRFTIDGKPAPLRERTA